MECNKDEAVRAKGIAEKKLLERDITGAKKFALKAQSLFPKLDGLSQFLEIIDVNVVHEKKIKGEANYYGILGVDPFADEVVLKKQYKRMALSLHPDKNRSVGADTAFKILFRAWDVLSDKDKRSSYNLKINIRASNQTSGFSASSSARNTTTATNPHQVPTRAKSTPGTATSQQYASAPHDPTNTTSGTKYQNIPSHQQTPAAAMTFGPPYNPETCKPFSDLNKGKPVKRRRTDVQKCDSANTGSQGTTGNGSGVKKGSANPKANLSSTTHAGARNQTTAINPQQVRTRPKSTPGIATCRQYASMPHNPTNTTSGTCSQNIPRRQQAPAAATTFGPPYNPVTCNSFSDLNKLKPVKRSRTDVQKCDSATKGSQGTAGKISGVKTGSANPKGNLLSTTHAGTRDRTGSFSSSSAKYTTSATNPKPVPTRPKAPGTTTSRQYASGPHHQKNTTSSTSSKHIPSRLQTPAASNVIGELGNPARNVQKYDSAKGGSKGVKWGSANLKGNLSTTHSVIRKHSSNHKTVKNNLFGSVIGPFGS